VAVEPQQLPAPHPIRLVVTDDLERSRLTVGFRLFLAIPHIIWVSLFAVAALVVVFISWWATLFSGQSPTGLHNFLSGFVRYVTQVEAYLFLGANPYPPFYLGDITKTYPIDVEIAPPATQNRWVTGFRIFLAVPAFSISSALSGGAGTYGGGGYYRSGGGIAVSAAVLIWFAALVRARAPRGLRDLVAWSLGYGAQLAGYFFLLTDRYPTTDPLVHVDEPDEDVPPPQPARGIVRDDLRRSRLTVFFRALLWVPHLVWWLLWTIVVWVLAIVNWIVTLITARPPRAFARFLSAYLRYTTHQFSYLTLIGNPFPGFVGQEGSYPIDLEVAVTAEKQKRLGIFFRGILAIPALVIASAGSGVVATAAFLGWFASLVQARMPHGLRNGGAWGLSYYGQTHAYLFLLTERYPFSGPTAVSWES